MVRKIFIRLLAFAHTRVGKLIADAASKGGAMLTGAGLIADDPQTLSIWIGILSMILGTAWNWTVFTISSRFIKDEQVLLGIKADGFAWDKTREAANIPRLNTDGTPILAAIPTENPKTT